MGFYQSPIHYSRITLVTHSLKQFTSVHISVYVKLDPDLYVIRGYVILNTLVPLVFWNNVVLYILFFFFLS
jgi:hypothetical protein